MALQAGIGRVCITPPLDIPNGMWAAQRHVRAEGLDMDLQATALVLAEGTLRIALLDLDLCFLRPEQAFRVREAVHQATGIPEENVLPFCSHNHAGPETSDSYRGEGEDRVRSYVQSLPHLIASAALQAATSITPVRVAAGLGRSEIGVNRDLRLPDGRFLVGCNPDGFFDPDVGVIRIDTAKGQPLACLVNYACHPTVLGPGNKLISPDYPGSTRKTVEQITGATCFFLQGAAGNVGPVDTFVDDVAVARRLGTCLGLEAAKVYLSLHALLTEKKLGSIVKSGAALAMYEYVPVDFSELGLGFVSAVLELPTRSPMGVWEKAADRLAEWKTKLDDLISQEAEPDEIAAAQQWVTREQLRTDFAIFFRGKRTIPAESYAIRLGDAAIAIVSGEPYSEIGAEVKARSPFPKKTLFAAYEGVHLPYIPTAEVFALQPPPMEVDHSPFAPEAARIATDHLVNLLITLDRSF